ncbi:hypothetical protein ACQP2Y_14610 [Actinoplanes sp. CA-051413]|uniref:hypothetical protein n=1 Tax=Actinoplanes sp. CA-051413 TaxID=3239899 RepID=UPI003D96C036
MEWPNRYAAAEATIPMTFVVELQYGQVQMRNEMFSSLRGLPINAVPKKTFGRAASV